MLDTWLKNNNLKSVLDISSPEQLEPFSVLSIYTKETCKQLPVPEFSSPPFIISGTEFNNNASFQNDVMDSLQDSSGLIYLDNNLDIDLTNTKNIDFTILKTFMSAKQYKTTYQKFSDKNDPSIFIEDTDKSDEIPNHCSRGVSASQQVQLGCNKTQELAFTLFSMITSPAFNTSDKMHFTFFNDNNFLLDIAKIRAFKFLYLQVLDRYKLPLIAPHIHIRINPFYYSLNEPWMNVKRQGSAVFSALASGIQSISLPAFDFRSPVDKVNGARVSRNIINILKEESHLAKVNDPARGSYSIESITYEMATHAWDILQQLINGSYDVNKEITAVSKKRIALYKDKKLKIVGSTIYKSESFKLPTNGNYLDTLLNNEGVL